MVKLLEGRDYIFLFVFHHGRERFNINRTEFRFQVCPFVEVRAGCLLKELGLIELTAPLTEEDPKGSKPLFLHTLSELAVPVGDFGRSKLLKGKRTK